MAALEIPGSMTDRSTCSTTRSEYGRDPNRRVAGALTLEQEEALIGLMYDNFQMNDCQSLDYDRVVRCALTLQCDPEVCKALGAPCVPMEQAWLPEDAWITDMCFAFTDADSQLTSRSKPVGAVTPGGISYLVNQGVRSDLANAPGQPDGEHPMAAVLMPEAPAANARAGSAKAKKKGKKKDTLSDTDLLAADLGGKKVRASTPKKVKKSPKRATPREVTI